MCVVEFLQGKDCLENCFAEWEMLKMFYFTFQMDLFFSLSCNSGILFDRFS